MKHYKWAYDAKTKELNVWEVDSPASYATPQHGDKLSKEEYASLYQGRVSVVNDDEVAFFTIYPERPFMDRTNDEAEAAETALRKWVTE